MPPREYSIVEQIDGLQSSIGEVLKTVSIVVATLANQDNITRKTFDDINNALNTSLGHTHQLTRIATETHQILQVYKAEKIKLELPKDPVIIEALQKTALDLAAKDSQTT